MRGKTYRWGIGLLLSLTIGCADPPAPGPTPTPQPPSTDQLPLTPTGLRIAQLDHVNRAAAIEWSAADRADRYVIEYWNLFDPSAATTTVETASAETRLTLHDVPGYTLSVRVRGKNAAGVGEPTVPVLLQIPLLGHAVEALFFGTGPYGSGQFLAPDERQLGNHIRPGRMLAWGDVPIRIVVEDAITSEQLADLERALAEFGELTGGAIRVEGLNRVPALERGFEAGVIRVLVRPQLGDLCGPPPVGGCAAQDVDADGRIRAAYIVVEVATAPRAMSHELGHALGLHHLLRLQLQPRPVMSIEGGPSDQGFSRIETAAVRLVYGAGLRHGASIDQFRQLGLLDRHDPDIAGR